MLLVIITALIYYFADINEHLLNIILFAIIVISVFSGGWISAKKSGQHGLINGLFCAVVYFIIILAISFIINKQISFTPHLTSMLLAGLASGMLGGILGINT